MPVPFAALLSLLPAAPLPDTGYDLLVLDMPRHVVMGDVLKFAVRGRPGNPFLVLGDAQYGQYPFTPNISIHLKLTSSLFVAGIGTLPANGSQPFALPVPNAPALDGTFLFFQAFGQDNGVIAQLTASDSKPVRFDKDVGQPEIPLFTVNRIPPDQNGIETAEGLLAVPFTGFTIDLDFNDRGKGAIDPTSLVVTADQPLGLGAIPAGTNLANKFTVTATGATATVDPSWSFPLASNVRLVASIRNVNGVSSARELYRLRVVALTSINRPFATTQLWFVDFDAHDLDNTGIPDFREDLVLFGLGNDPSATSGPSFNVAAQARAQTLAQLSQNYGVGGPDPVDIAFSDQPPSGVYARICVGGRNTIPASQLPPGAQETTGSAYINPRNQRKNFVDCFQNLGVHPRSVFYLFKDVPAFKLVFDPLRANPVGNDPDDAFVTAPGFNPQNGTVHQRVRWQEIQNGLQAVARSVAFVLTQETSHSMGLVPGGPLNQGGLLGEYMFGHSTFGHFDDGLGNFLSGNNSTPAPAQPANLALVWDHFQSGRAHFTALNWAYLRERVVNQ